MEWDPFEEMREFQRRMNRAFESFFRDGEGWKLKGIHHPPSDVVDKGDHFIVRIDLPGVEKEDIILNVTESYIEVRAQRKHEVKVEKKGYFKQERSYGSYYRVIPLPDGVDTDSVRASYKNGVLEVRLQKSKTKKLVKKVKVE